MSSPQRQPGCAWISSTKGHSGDLCAGSLRTVIPTSREAQIGGDAMAGGNGGFYKEQSIDAGTVQLRGPLELEKDQTLSKMYIWLWQENGDGTGAAATAVLDGRGFDNAAARDVGGAEWQTMAQPEHGEFRAGPATGMALAILKRADGSTTPYWWSDSNIRLKEGLTDRSALTTQLAEAFQAVADTLKRL